jgi:hypothetical protein
MPPGIKLTPLRRLQSAREEGLITDTEARDARRALLGLPSAPAPKRLRVEDTETKQSDAPKRPNLDEDESQQSRAEDSQKTDPAENGDN